MEKVIVREKIMPRSPALDKVAFFQNVQNNQMRILRYKVTTLRTLLVFLAVINVTWMGYYLSKRVHPARYSGYQVQTQVPLAGKMVSGALKKASAPRSSERNAIMPMILKDGLQTDHQVLLSFSSRDQKVLRLVQGENCLNPRSNGVDARISATTLAEPANLPCSAKALVKYVGSKTSNKYHHPHCQWVKQIQSENLLGFGSVQEAQSQGYMQCRYCSPPLKDAQEGPQQAQAKQ